MAKSSSIQPATLSAQIAEVIADNVKAYNVPAFCVRMGIQADEVENDKHEAHNSKRTYVKTRIISLPLAALLSVAQRVHDEYPDDELADFLSAARYEKKKVSELVRRDMLKLLNPVEMLFGERPLFDVLELVFGATLFSQDNFLMLGPHPLKQRIEQHYLRNTEDMSNEAMLTECGALTCSQARFFSLLEEVLHPTSRRDESQRELAHQLATGLSRSATPLP